MATEAQSLFVFPTPPPLMPEDRTLSDLPADHNGDKTSLAVAITDPGMDLAKKTVCIKVRLSTMGNTRKVSTAQIETDADKDLLRVSKQLVDSEELKSISGSTAKSGGSSTTFAFRSRSESTFFRLPLCRRSSNVFANSRKIEDSLSMRSSPRIRASAKARPSDYAVSTIPLTTQRSKISRASLAFRGSTSASAYRIN